MEYFVTMKGEDIRTIRIKRKDLCDVYSEECSYGPFETKKKAREFINHFLDNYYDKLKEEQL